MKLENISHLQGFYSFSKNNALKQKKNFAQNTEHAQNFAPLPLTKQFLAFTGGYSLSLAQTLENMPKSAFPPDIYKMAQEEVKSGNLEDKTLIDIHRSKYGKISQMTSLEEVKAEYPEFKDVLPDYKVNYSKNSFMDDVKEDRLEWFDSEVDLSLQLLQMYWAEGFSLNDLKEYTGGKSIQRVFENLNIPRLNSTYGSVLKLSDKDYNKRFTDTMSEKQKSAQRTRAEKKDGVYIPRGPISEETRQKISESLIKHYSEHPEKVTEMSVRMKQYYKEHPDEKEKLSFVMKKAWDLREAKPIRKRMSKFFGKQDISSEEFAKMNLGEDEAPKKSLKEFWKRNPWAREQWSKAMQQAWNIYRKHGLEALKGKEKKKYEPPKILETRPISLKEVDDRPSAKYDEHIYEFNLFSSKMQANMKKWFRKHGYDNKKIAQGYTARIYPDNLKPPAPDKYNEEAITAYFDVEAHGDMLSDVYQIGMFKAMNVIMDKLVEDKIPMEDSLLVLSAIIFMGDELFDKNNRPRVLDSKQIMLIYTSAIYSLVEFKQQEYAKIIEQSLDVAQDILDRKDNFEILRIANRAVSMRNVARQMGDKWAEPDTMPKQPD